MSPTDFTLDDITLAYSEEDYKPQRREPAPGLWFELAVKEATIEQSKHGYLQVKLVTEALDKDGGAMFKKWISLAVPVGIKDIVPPNWTKGVWLSGVRSLFPEDAAFDRQEKDEITGQKIYWKGDTQVKAGKEFEDAQTAANKRIAERAKEVAKVWIQQGDGAALPDFAGKHVFGKTIESKDGKYINIDKMLSEVPREAEVVYDQKTAFGK